MFGLTAAVGLAPRLVAQAVATRVPETAAATSAGKPAIVVRPDARAVSRREGTV